MHVADELQLEAKQLPPLNVKPAASSLAGELTPPINSSRALIAEVRCLPHPPPWRLYVPHWLGACPRDASVRNFNFSPDRRGPRMLFSSCLHPCVSAAN